AREAARIAPWLSPLTLVGEGLGRGAFDSRSAGNIKAVSCACADARVTSPLLVHAAAGAVANSEAGPKGGGQDARSQVEVTKRKRHPAASLSVPPWTESP